VNARAARATNWPMLHPRCLLALPALLLAIPACPNGNPGFGGDGTTSDTATGGGGQASTSSSSVSAGPVVRIHMRANTKPFAHTDGLSGQTPIAHASGMRKFQLLKDASDPSPVTIFDYGTGFVEAGYNDGDDTVVATVPIKTLTTGVYTVGRTVHSHVRYQVSATVHAFGLNVPGTFDNVQVMSDDTLLDGVMRNAGHYDYRFTAAGQSYPATGENAPVPTYLDTGGFGVKFESGEWAYYFPVALTLSPDVPTDVDMVMEVNMYQSFRWQDQGGAGNAAGVFDVTPPTFEPVLRFGANSYAVYSE
jgi:hypothetical protein